MTTTVSNEPSASVIFGKRSALFATSATWLKPKVITPMSDSAGVTRPSRCAPRRSRDWKKPTMKEASVYAAIRQGKAKTGMAEEVARRIKEGAVPIISDVEGFKAYYVVIRARRHRNSDQHLQ